MNKPKTLLISSFISVALLSGFANADDHSPTPPKFTPGIDIEAFWISKSSHDKGTCAHASRDNPHLSFLCPHCAFPCDKAVLTKMTLSGDIVVMTVHR